MKKVDDDLHTSRSAHGDPAVVAKILDGRLQEANGSRRTLLSRETVAELLRLVAAGEQLAWARSHETRNGYGDSSSATLALCARVNTDELCIGITRGPAKAASPGRAWQDLQPWRPTARVAAQKLRRWWSTAGEDRICISAGDVEMIARELANLPAAKIRWKESVSTQNDVFVLRDFAGPTLRR
jgi:hypothetical protein